LNGAGYAQWTDLATLPSRRVVDTSAAFADRLITVEEVATHRHGPEGQHAHRATRFTTWLDPILAVEQARTVTEALERLLPAHSAELRAGFDALARDLGALDRDLARWAESVGDEPLLFSHPVYDYFIRRYSLDGRLLHWEPDVAPDEGGWRALEKALEGHEARTMIWEGPPAAATATALAERGISSIVLAPCANRPDEGDFLSVMHANAERLLAQSASRLNGHTTVD